MKDIVTISAGELQFPDYQREILKRGICGFFLPVTFLTAVRGGKPVVKAFGEDRTGYTPLEAVGEIGEKRMHLLLTGILTGVREAANCYLMPGDYQLTERTICFNEKEESVRCLFLPSGHVCAYPAVDLPREAGRALGKLLGEVKEKCRGSAAKDLAQIAEMLEKRRGGIDTALLSVARMKRRETGKIGLI